MKLGLFGVVGLLAASPLSSAPPPPMPAFLSGCWEQREGAEWTEECWTSDRGGLMIGSGRAGAGDSVQHWEWMRIERGRDGEIRFYASPKGAAPAAFPATEATATSVTFVNAAHDYPQRVRYVVTPDGLDAEISLADGSKPNRWRYRRPGAPTK